VTVDELDALHWATLKRLVEAKGGVYESKVQAVLFLSDKDISAEEMKAIPVDPPKPKVKSRDSTMDFDKPYGTISGEFEIPNARYIQNGLYFSADGKQVG
jgi:hypothetical protein